MVQGVPKLGKSKPLSIKKQNKMKQVKKGRKDAAIALPHTHTHNTHTAHRRTLSHTLFHLDTDTRDLSPLSDTRLSDRHGPLSLPLSERVVAPKTKRAVTAATTTKKLRKSMTSGIEREMTRRAGAVLPFKVSRNQSTHTNDARLSPPENNRPVAILKRVLASHARFPRRHYMAASVACRASFLPTALANVMLALMKLPCWQSVDCSPTQRMRLQHYTQPLHSCV